MMLPLHTRASVHGLSGRAILKVLDPTEAAFTDLDRADCLLWLDGSSDLAINQVDGWAGVISTKKLAKQHARGIVIDEITNPRVIAPGDVIRATEGSAKVSVIYRRGSNSNTLFATENCNSFCLMCSQPPRDVDDRWLVDEMLATISLVDKNETQLGISGGEPTLLGDDLLVVLHHAMNRLPNTGLHILSNGRKFSEEPFAHAMCAVHHPGVEWGIPVYSASPEIHDYIVQARGAWDETLAGLYNLARHGAPIEIRVVVQKANMGHLGELAYFIFRNLSFVKHVAFMGLEPIGFARSNYDAVWADPADYAEELQDAVFYLANRGLNVSAYNVPLCTMPVTMWPFCRKSISDWKNIYEPECGQCDARGKCGGFFASLGKNWKSRAIAPIQNRPEKSHPNFGGSS